MFLTDFPDLETHTKTPLLARTSSRPLLVPNPVSTKNAKIDNNVNILDVKKPHKFNGKISKRSQVIQVVHPS